MAGERVAQRYAKALMELAQERNSVDKVNTDVKFIRKTLKECNDLSIAIKSPVVPNRMKSNVLKTVFKKEDELCLRLMELLISNNRIGMLDLVLLKFQQYYNRLNGIKNATVISAEELNLEIEKRLSDKLKTITGSKEILLTKKIDKRLLGGFVLRVDDIQYDASILGKLNTLKVKFKNTTI